jgi:hypothetical protein
VPGRLVEAEPIALESQLVEHFRSILEGVFSSSFFPFAVIGGQTSAIPSLSTFRL